MNKTLSFIRLDFHTVKPYLTTKNLLIFVAVALIFLIGNKSTSGATGMLMAYAAIYATYPFILGEKNNIDVLYTTLPIRRKTVVLGRYLFALIIDMATGLFTLAFSLVVLSVMQTDFSVVESVAAMLVIFTVFSIMQAIQLPIYFKLGYTKAKFLAYLPFVVLPLAVFAASNLFADFISIQQLEAAFDWFAAHVLLMALAGVVMWIGIQALSYRISLSFYEKRDF